MEMVHKNCKSAKIIYKVSNPILKLCQSLARQSKLLSFQFSDETVSGEELFYSQVKIMCNFSYITHYLSQDTQSSKDQLRTLLAYVDQLIIRFEVRSFSPRDQILGIVRIGKICQVITGPGLRLKNRIIGKTSKCITKTGVFFI